MKIQVKTTCKKCKGEGTVTSPEYTYSHTCPECHGTGGKTKWLPINEALLSSKLFQELLAKH